MPNSFRKLWNIITTIISLPDIIQWLFTGGAWWGVAMLDKIVVAPTWFYITLIIITVLLGTVSILNIIFRYKKWLRISYVEDPQITEILALLRNIHEITVKITRDIDIKKFISSKKWDKAQNNILDIWEVPTNKISKSIGKYKGNFNRLIKMIVKVTRFNPRSKKSIMQLLNMGSVLEEFGNGINTYRKNNLEYSEAIKKLSECRDKLSVSNEKVSEVIDNAQIYSYCVCSLLLYSRMISIKLKRMRIDFKKTNKMAENLFKSLVNKCYTQTITYDNVADMLLNKKLEIIRLMIKEYAMK